MRTLNILGLASLMVLSGSAAMAATSSADASARIVTAISISKIADMDFADIAAGSTDGTVILSTSGGLSSTGGVHLMASGAASAAQFTVSGDPGAGYDITLPSSVTLTSGVNTMTVDTFVSDPAGSGTLTGGEEQVSVGATLHVGTWQASGLYQGSFDVTVAYN